VAQSTLSNEPLEGDPVSWLMIRLGWKVVSADGELVGRVWRVKAERSRDIFNGLTFLNGLSRARYVPSEEIAEIRKGVVTLKARAAELGQSA
jgi:hypothetical protein